MVWKKILTITGALVVTGLAIRLMLDSLSESNAKKEKENVGLTHTTTTTDHDENAVLDLDNQDTLGNLESDGLTLGAYGGERHLSVKENLSTGYSWVIDKKSCNKDVVHYQESHV